MRNLQKTLHRWIPNVIATLVRITPELIFATSSRQMRPSAFAWLATTTSISWSTSWNRSVKPSWMTIS